MKTIITSGISILAIVLSSATSVAGKGEEPVTVDNFVRAETDHMIRMNMKALGLTMGELNHDRQPRTAEQQTVIRENQDTLYSGVVLDFSKPVTLTLPETGGRYMSAQVINQDHHMFVETEPGDYELTEQTVGSRFALVLLRTFVDANDPDDIAAAHRAQDGITVTGGGAGPFEAPDWSLDDLGVIRKALNDVAALGFDTTYAFGAEDEVRPVDYLIGAAVGWGGLPKTAALYVIDSVDANDGSTPHVVTVEDVPVGAFWSITVYNADGYLEANELNRNNYNDVTAEKNDDGSVTIHFGGCGDGRINCIPVPPGWSYTVRLYEPGPEILDGNWTFPKPQPTD